MRIVVDANVVIAALTKKSVTRELLLRPFMNYYVPEFMLSELKKHEKEIMTKTHLNKEEYAAAVSLMLTNINTISKLNYGAEIGRATKLIGRVDMDDVPYLALALAIKADGIWTYDKDFGEQSAIEVLKTKDVAAIVRSSR